MRKRTFWTCGPNEDLDQPAHSRSLIRFFAGRTLKSQGRKVSSCGQRRLWSDCTHAQTDLSVRWSATWENVTADSVSRCVSRYFFSRCGSYVLHSSSGYADVPETAPDTITSWIATAFAVHDSAGLGLTESPAQVLVSSKLLGYFRRNYPAIRVLLRLEMRQRTISLNTLKFCY